MNRIYRDNEDKLVAADKAAPVEVAVVAEVPVVVEPSLALVVEHFLVVHDLLVMDSLEAENLAELEMGERLVFALYKADQGLEMSAAFAVVLEVLDREEHVEEFVVLVEQAVAVEALD